MAAKDVAAAMQRAQAVFQRRPAAAVDDDSVAKAIWGGGTRIVASHANGTQVSTDMPSELGGTGDRVTPGWLFRAGIASCSATAIAMVAASEEIELTALEVQASSRSDARGLLGMTESDGKPVYAGARDVRLHVRIAASNASSEHLRALVGKSLRRSPTGATIEHANTVTVHIDVGTA